MWRCTLWFVLLLRLTRCSFDKDDQEPVAKTIGKEADLTPVCSNSSQKPILFINCRIRPVRSREEECLLAYHLKTGFEQGCDSRFSLMLINQTMFLHLNNLTPENSGNYSCQCSGPGGTFTLQLNITVEDDKDNTSPLDPTTFPTILISLFGVCGLIIIILLGVISGCICRNKCQRRRRRCEVTITPHPNTEVQDIDPYRVFRENELYLTSVIHTSLSTNNLIVIGMDNPSSGRPL